MTGYRNEGFACALGVAALLAASPSPAQDDAETQREVQRVEREIVIRDQEPAEQDERLRAAERRLQEAAQEIAEITSGIVPGAVEYARHVVLAKRRPILGVSIGGRGDDDGGPVDGVQVLGVSPGSPAEEAGIEAGDTLIRIGEESLAAPSASEANERLLHALGEREPGDTIALELVRGGKKISVDVKTRDSDTEAFAFFGDKDFDIEFDGSAPMVWFGSARPWGDMELIEVTPGLGRYFGVESGLLVIRAPKDPALKLEDGDVIRRIGGREPNSVAHAMRILRSYDEGEEFELEIKRDKRDRKIAIQVPASQGRLAPSPLAPMIPVAPEMPGTPIAPRTWHLTGTSALPEV